LVRIPEKGTKWFKMTNTDLSKHTGGTNGTGMPPEIANDRSEINDKIARKK